MIQVIWEGAPISVFLDRFPEDSKKKKKKCSQVWKSMTDQPTPGVEFNQPKSFTDLITPPVQ